MQLATKRSVEEQILKKGKKKLALEQALIEGIDVEDDNSMDFESILRDGAQALFEDDDGENGDEAYTSAEVDAILDQREKERKLEKDDEESAVTHFSSVRVWAHDKGTFITENVVQSKSDAPDLGKWKILLQERKLAAAAEAKKNLEDLGRGKRARKKTDYTGKGSGAIEGDLSEEESTIGRKKRNRRAGEEGDGDFGPAEASEDESEDLGQVSERSGSQTFGSKGTKVEILTKSISTPPTMSVKAPKGRALNSSVRSAKLQQGVKIKKGVDVSRPQPKIGTAVKRPKAPVMIESKAKNSRSLGKMQQAQINGHTACSKGAETQKMATGFPAKQQARIIDLPPEPNIAKRESKVIKQVALFSGLPAKTKQADTSDEVEANKASIALATQSALGGPSLVSSERRSPSPSLSKTRAAGHKSQTNTISRRLTNSVFAQRLTVLAPVKNQRHFHNGHLLECHNQIPCIVSRIERTTTRDMSHLTRLPFRPVLQFSMIMETVILKTDMDRNAEMDHTFLKVELENRTEAHRKTLSPFSRKLSLIELPSLPSLPSLPLAADPLGPMDHDLRLIDPGLRGVSIIPMAAKPLRIFKNLENLTPGRTNQD
jgi:hypothetical protein